MRRVPILNMVTVLLVAGVSIGLIFLGPHPIGVESSEALSEYGARFALHEPVDRLVLLTWLAIAGIMAVLVLVPTSARRTRGLTAISWWADNEVARLLVLIASGLVLLSSIFWAGNLWSGIPLAGLWIGVILSVFAYGSIRVNQGRWLFGFVLAASLALSILIPGLLQWPGSIRDPDHFAYVADELSAFATGRTPLDNFIPQYSALLGLPIAPLLRLGVGEHAIIVGWLIVLQVLTVVAVLLFSVVSNGRRYFPASLLLLVGPLLLINDENSERSPNTYFQVFPLRVVLPTVLLLATLWILTRGTGSDEGRSIWRLPIRWFMLGLLMGVTVLNNLDFGLAAVGAASLTIFLAQSTLRNVGKVGGLLILGATSSLAVAFVALMMAGSSAKLELSLIFPLVFGQSGFFAQPIGVFGPYVAVVAAFIAATTTGVLLLRRGRSRVGRVYKSGVALLLSGSWGLLALPYFAGRSYDATLVAGFGVPLVLVAIAFLPLTQTAFMTFRESNRGPDYPKLVALTLSSILMIGVFSTWSLVESPGEQWRYNEGKFGLHSTVADAEVQFVRDLLTNSAPGLPADLGGGSVAQILPHSGLVDLETGMDSVSVTNSVHNLLFSPRLVVEQCREEIVDSRIFLLASKETAAILSDTAECGDVIDFANSVPLEEGYVMLKLREAGDEPT